METNDIWSEMIDGVLYHIDGRPFHDKPNAAACYFARSEEGNAPFVVKFSTAMPGSPEAQRFDQEVEILERYASSDATQKPHVVRMVASIDAPVSHGTKTYPLGYVMPRLEPLDDYVKKHGLPSAKEGCGNILSEKHAVEICLSVAESLDALSRPSGQVNGVIHRDVKPANILRDPHNDHWCLADFGIAKQDEKDRLVPLQTQAGAQFGTFGYMAPEQNGHNDSVGTWTDVFGLGATLCELVTGAPPFPRNPTEGRNSDNALRDLMDDHAAASIRQRNPKLSEDLEAIVDACLVKDHKKRRYQHCGELAEDLRNLQAGRDISIRHLGSIEKAKRWVNRRPFVAASFAVLVLSALACIAFLTVNLAQQRRHNAQLQVANDETQTALRREKETANRERLAKQEQAEISQSLQRSLVANHLAQGENALDRNDPITAFRHFSDGYEVEADSPERAKIHIARLESTLRHCPGLIACRSHDSAISVHWNEARKLYVTVNAAGEIKTWDENGGSVRTVSISGQDTGSHKIEQVHAASDGDVLVARCNGGSAHLFNYFSGVNLGTIKGERPFNNVAISPDGRAVAAANTRHQVFCFDTATREAQTAALEHRELVKVLEFSPDSQMLATGCGQAGRSNFGAARIWRVSDGMPVTDWLSHSDDVQAAEFSTNSNILAVGDWNGQTRLWNTRTGKQIGETRYQRNEIRSIHYAKSMLSFVTVSADQTTWIWPGSNHLGGIPLPHETEIISAITSSTGYVLTQSISGEVAVWQTAPSLRIVRRIPVSSPIVSVVAATNNRVAILDANGTFRIWHLSLIDFPDRSEFHPNAELFAFSEAGDRCFVTTGPHHQHEAKPTVCAYSWLDGEPVADNIQLPKHVHSLQMSRDGRIAVIGFHDDSCQVWDVVDYRPLPSVDGDIVEGTPVGFAKDDRSFFARNLAGYVIRYQVNERVVESRRSEPVVAFHGAVVADSDGSVIGIGADGHLRVLAADTLVPLRRSSKAIPMYNKLSQHHLSLSENETLVAIAHNRHLSTWSLEEDSFESRPNAHQGAITAVRISPDTNQIATSSQDLTVRRWDAKSLEPLGSPLDHPDEVNNVIFSPDGDYIATGAGHSRGTTGVARVWDATTGHPVSPWLLHNNDVYHLRFHTVRNELWTTSWDGFVHIWSFDSPFDVSRASLLQLRNVLGLHTKSDGLDRAPLGAEAGAAWDYITGNGLTRSLSPAAKRRHQLVLFDDYSRLFPPLLRYDFAQARQIVAQLDKSDENLVTIAEGWVDLYSGRNRSACEHFATIDPNSLERHYDWNGFHKPYVWALTLGGRLKEAKQVAERYLAKSFLLGLDRRHRLDVRCMIGDFTGAEEEARAGEKVEPERTKFYKERIEWHRQNQSLDLLLAESEGTRSIRFVIFQKLPWEQREELLAQMIRLKYLPVQFRIYKDGDDVFVAGIFRRVASGTGTRVIQHDGATDSFLEECSELDSKTWYPVDVSGCGLDDEKNRYLAVFRQRLPADGNATISNKTGETKLERAFTFRDFAGVAQSLSIATNDSDESTTLPVFRIGLAKAFEAQGLERDVLQNGTAMDQLVAPIAEENMVVVHSESLQEHLIRTIEEIDKGMIPVSISIQAKDDGVVATSLWRQE